MTTIYETAIIVAAILYTIFSVLCLIEYYTDRRKKAGSFEREEPSDLPLIVEAPEKKAVVLVDIEAEPGACAMTFPEVQVGKTEIQEVYHSPEKPEKKKTLDSVDPLDRHGAPKIWKEREFE